MLDARGPDFVHHRIDVLLLEVRHGDIRPFAREEMRRRPAHAAGGAGDEGRLAFDRA
ncbi:MAG: hypothetical protein R3C04_00085 [Hyphomonas sp.]